MKQRLLTKIGKALLLRGKMRICIIDDEEAYFNDQMLAIARDAGYPEIERRTRVDSALLSDLLRRPRDIVILDIMGIVDENVGRDGFDVAHVLMTQTRSYVVVTSANKFHLDERHSHYDDLIESRLLTGIDFVQELDRMVKEYLTRKLRFYQKISYRLGTALLKKATLLPGA
jgi:hypothetical protein